MKFKVTVDLYSKTYQAFLTDTRFDTEEDFATSLKETLTDDVKNFTLKLKDGGTLIMCSAAISNAAFIIQKIDE